MEINRDLKKTKSITRIFTVYIASFALFMAMIILSAYLFISLGITRGFILPADYMEKAINQGVENIERYSSYDEWMPEGAYYSVFDSNGRVVEKNCDDKATELMWKSYQHNYPVTGKKYFKYLHTDDGICVIQYYIAPRFRNPDLYRICRNPEKTSWIIVLVSFAAGVIILRRRLSKRIGREFMRFNSAIREIEMDSLDFQIQSSDIKEINDLIISFNKMKNGLQESLSTQWKLEEQRRLQTAALAHDIKTPLTILKGNAELMEETDITEEQKEYCDNIMRNIDNIESYILRLIDVMKAESNRGIDRRYINFKSFMENLSDDINAMALPLNIRTRIVTGDLPSQIFTDEGALKRALMNIISNACQYSAGDIRVTVDSRDNYITFVVEDSGKGFSKEDIAHAREEFYQGDKSRSGTKHYGLGMYIAEKMTGGLGGQMILGNSSDLGGARVELVFGAES